VQDLKNSVPLIAGKRTLVRVYLSTAGHTPVTVRGTLGARRAGGGGWTQIPATTAVVLNPANAGPGGLRRKREDLSLSLNFPLPRALLVAGRAEGARAQLGMAGPPAPLAVPAGARRQVTFRAAVPLRVHVIGVRYGVHTGGGPVTEHEPALLDYA